MGGMSLGPPGSQQGGNFPTRSMGTGPPMGQNPGMMGQMNPPRGGNFPTRSMGTGPSMGQNPTGGMTQMNPAPRMPGTQPPGMMPPGQQPHRMSTGPPQSMMGPPPNSMGKDTYSLPHIHMLATYSYIN